jgi:hypothetical protein
VDGELALIGDEYDDLEKVAGAIWPDDEPAVGILANVLDGQGVVDSVDHVSVLDAVAAS